MKNVIIFLAGFLLGAGGLYAYHSQNRSVELGPDESTVEQTSEIAVADDTLIGNATRSDKALLDEIKSLKLQLAEKGKGIVDINSKSVTEDSDNETIDESEMSEEDFSSAMMELIEKKNKPTAEEERLGSIALEELKHNQPIELKKLFNEDPDSLNPLNAQTENQYKKHLSQEKDINWAYEAEGFLKNYFSTGQNTNFTALRIDCRSRTCEIAGLFVSEDDLQNLQDSTQQEILISGRMNGRVQSFMKVRQDIQKHPFYERYFESGLRNMHFSPQTLTLNPMPYSFFLNRASVGN